MNGDIDEEEISTEQGVFDPVRNLVPFRHRHLPAHAHMDVGEEAQTAFPHPAISRRSAPPSPARDSIFPCP